MIDCYVDVDGKYHVRKGRRYIGILLAKKDGKENPEIAEDLNPSETEDKNEIRENRP